MHAGSKCHDEARNDTVHKLSPPTNKQVVQRALQTEDMDQEAFLTKVKQRKDRYANKN